MKLASLKSGRDGRLVVVDRSLTNAVFTPSHLPTFQSALDGYHDALPVLIDLSDRLERGEVESFPFDPSACDSPLPRAYQFADGSAYVNHVELVRQSRGASMPESFWSDPLLYQGSSDSFIAPMDPIRLQDEAWDVDFEAEIAVITGDVAKGCTPQDALKAIKFFVLLNDVSLRGLIPSEVTKGFGFFQSKPPSSLSPVAVTPEELGVHWRDGRIHLPLLTFLNGREFGHPDAGTEMVFDFGTLVAHASRTRRLGAGTIIGSGTVSTRGADNSPGKPVGDGGAGYSCILEQRVVETLSAGRPKTPFLKHGDRVTIEMRLPDGQSIFGAIDQKLEIG